MSEILFSYPGSHKEGAPNDGLAFNHRITIPKGMRVPCVGEGVTIPTPKGETYHTFRVHVVDHVYPFNEHNREPYTYIVLRYG